MIPIESFKTLIGSLNEELEMSYEPKHLNATHYSSWRWQGVYERKPEELAKQGIPAKSSFYNDEIIEGIHSVYQEDIDFYRRHNPGLTIPTP